MIHLKSSSTAQRRQKKPTAALPTEGKGTVHMGPRLDRETIQARCDCLNTQIKIVARLARRQGLVVQVDASGVWITDPVQGAG